MVGSVTAAIDSTVRTPRDSISSTTRSLCTTCPRIAPRPPPAAKRFTFRSAMRTPEQKPYLAARLTFIPSANALRAGNILPNPLLGRDEADVDDAPPHGVGSATRLVKTHLRPSRKHDHVAVAAHVMNRCRSKIETDDVFSAGC